MHRNPNLHASVHYCGRYECSFVIGKGFIEHHPRALLQSAQEQQEGGQESGWIPVKQLRTTGSDSTSLPAMCTPQPSVLTPSGSTTEGEDEYDSFDEDDAHDVPPAPPLLLQRPEPLCNTHDLLTAPATDALVGVLCPKPGAGHLCEELFVIISTDEAGLVQSKHHLARDFRDYSVMANFAGAPWVLRDPFDSKHMCMLKPVQQRAVLRGI
jgi:hypothetical protein